MKSHLRFHGSKNYNRLKLGREIKRYCSRLFVSKQLASAYLQFRKNIFFAQYDVMRSQILTWWREAYLNRDVTFMNEIWLAEY